MPKIEELTFLLSSLSIYRNVLKTPVAGALYRLMLSTKSKLLDFARAWGDFFATLCQQGGSENLKGCIEQAVLFDDNVFTRALCKGDNIPENIVAAARRDLMVLERMARLLPEFFANEVKGIDFSHMPVWKTGEAKVLKDNWHDHIDTLSQYHFENGYGIFAESRAFIWQGDRLRRVINPDPVTLRDIKFYEHQKKTVLDNTLAFVKRRPANNVLLYGDRGTGKSSTVKALANEFCRQGLRIVELPKDGLGGFAGLLEHLSKIPLKFIVFIDDLSFSDSDSSFSALKAVLQGGIVAQPENVLIYATSNRRHLVRESFSARQGDEIHINDTIEEVLSLSDRFGLVVTYMLPSKQQYLDIVRQIAADKGLEIDEKTLEQGAEQWALRRGGRSPRCAQQYIVSLLAEKG